jgi:hypothetical protein
MPTQGGSVPLDSGEGGMAIVAESYNPCRLFESACTQGSQDPTLGQQPDRSIGRTSRQSIQDSTRQGERR